MPERSGDQIVKTTTEARAGQTGRGVRWMVILGTGAVVVIFVVLWLYYFG